MAVGLRTPGLSGAAGWGRPHDPLPHRAGDAASGVLEGLDFRSPPVRRFADPERVDAPRSLFLVMATWDIHVRRFGMCEIALEGQKVESNEAC